MNPITDIAFEQIGNTKYYWAQYGPFRVIMDRTTGYINATHLCKQTTPPRLLGHWRENAHSNDILNAVSSSIGYPIDDLLTVVTGGQITEIRGTYAHPDLVPHIAAWASPKFAVAVSRIVNEHFVREYKESIRAKDTRIDELIKEVRAQTSTIEDQMRSLEDQKMMIKDQTARIDDQSRQIAELLGYAKETKSTLDHVVVQNDSLLQEARETSIAVEYQVERATESIDTILPNKTVTPPSKSIQYFCLYSHATATTRFYAVRGQQTNLDRARPKLISAGYVLEPIYSREDPNPFHSFNTLKRLLDEGARALLQQKRVRGHTL